MPSLHRDLAGRADFADHVTRTGSLNSLISTRTCGFLMCRPPASSQSALLQLGEHSRSRARRADERERDGAAGVDAIHLRQIRASSNTCTFTSSFSPISVAVRADGRRGPRLPVRTRSPASGMTTPADTGQVSRVSLVAVVWACSQSPAHSAAEGPRSGPVERQDGHGLRLDLRHRYSDIRVTDAELARLS